MRQLRSTVKGEMLQHDDAQCFWHIRCSRVHHYQTPPLTWSQTCHQESKWATWMNTHCVSQPNNSHQTPFRVVTMACVRLHGLKKWCSFLGGLVAIFLHLCVYVCVFSIFALLGKSYPTRAFLRENTDRRQVHPHLVDKQSERHKGTIATVLLPIRQTCPFKMSNKKSCCKAAVFYWFQMGSSSDHYDQFMDSLYLGYKVVEEDQ